MISDSSEGGANVQIEFDWGVDTDVKAIEAKEKIESIRNQLPTDVERLLIEKFNTSDMAVLVIRISSERDLSNAYDLLNSHVKRRLERLKGVSRVSLYGIEKRQILIRLASDRLVAHGVDLNRLSRVLRDSNFLVTAGRIDDDGKRFTVRPMGELGSIEDLGALIIGGPRAAAPGRRHDRLRAARARPTGATSTAATRSAWTCSRRRAPTSSTSATGPRPRSRRSAPTRV